MERLYVLGTGNASVTRCFNTCFVIRDDAGRCFMVDAGGGNGVLTQMEKMQIPLEEIHDLFVTHEHTDHLLGVIWIVRTIGQMIQKQKYEGNLHIYCHEGLEDKIRTICEMTVAAGIVKLFGERIYIDVVQDGEERKILDYTVQFFDIRSNKAKQFGFVMHLKDGQRLTFCGDEPYQEHCYAQVQGADWLLHEAFCLYGEREHFKPYEKCHSTVKDAAQLAEDMDVKNLILWHTEDKNIRRRKSMYKKEARKYFHGRIYVPYDREVIELSRRGEEETCDSDRA